MIPFHNILTHPGGAHKDEFLACCVLLTVQPVPVVRREPTPAELADAGVCVVDVGHQHEPVRNNFDHHQLPKDHPPTCSLSLVLQALGLYEDALEFHPWLEVAEWFDARGPFATADWLKVDRDTLARLASPIDGALLRRFAASGEIAPGEPLWEIMRDIGADIVGYVRTLGERLSYLEKHAEFWSFALPGGTSEVLFLPRTEPALDDPSLGLDPFIERRGKLESVVATVSPDRRGGGYGLSRFRDAAALDFTRIAQCPDVHFAHARGFVAKTSASTPERLRELLQIAAKKA
ncbi:MAG TPA: MYG1 family protein [Opitutaceae bacterium]